MIDHFSVATDPKHETVLDARSMILELSESVPLFLIAKAIGTNYQTILKLSKGENPWLSERVLHALGEYYNAHKSSAILPQPKKLKKRLSKPGSVKLSPPP